MQKASWVFTEEESSSVLELNCIRPPNTDTRPWNAGVSNLVREVSVWREWTQKFAVWLVAASKANWLELRSQQNKMHLSTVEEVGAADETESWPGEPADLKDRRVYFLVFWRPLNSAEIAELICASVPFCTSRRSSCLCACG